MPQSGPFTALPPGSLRIVQLTDTHIYADPAGCLLGLNTQNSLDAVLDLTQRLRPVDLVLATRHLVHDASALGYSRLRERLSGLNAPVYCLPGNHDRQAPMREHLIGGPVEMPPWVLCSDWLLVFLDSTVPEEDGGHLRPDEFDSIYAIAIPQDEDTVARGVVFLDAAGVAHLELLGHHARQHVKKKVSGKGLYTGCPFGPGYNGMPLDYQSQLFEHVNATGIGVKLNDSGVMLPMKSISFWLRITANKKAAEDHGYKCSKCDMENCLYRKVPHKNVR